MSLHLDQLIPLRDAARLFGLSEARLHELLEAGKIRGAILPGGEIGVSESAAKINALNENLSKITREPFENLRGVHITASEGAKKYGVHRNTILKWAKQGFVRVIVGGYRMEVDEADLAYCASIHDQRKDLGNISTPLLDDMGRPCLLKHPRLSEYRRRRKKPD